MKRLFLAGAVAGIISVCGTVNASPLVTSNVPLDSNYYLYIEKLEAMGYIKDMPTGTKPYSRLDIAKWLADVNTNGMPDYLKVYYDEMSKDLAAEIAYVRNGDNDAAFESNLKLRNFSLNAIYVDADHTSYKYSGQGINGHWQPLNKNNNGYRYADGFNAIAKADISGSLNKDFALNITPRFSYDDDQHGDASLQEATLKTHLGVWGFDIGKMPLQWGGRHGSFAYSNNAEAHTMIKANLLEPHTFDNGFLKFLGKANVNVFYSQMEGNRRELAHDFSSRWDREKDHADLVGVRVDIVPTDNFTLGLERVSMLKSFDSDWFTGTNAYANDKWNDIAGFDMRLRLPGMQVYGSLYGEDQAHCFPSEKAYSAGLYFPQLTQDGSWDLRLEGAKTNNAWYSHGSFVNGWIYKDNIMGNSMGKDALQYSAEINHYMSNGNRLGLRYTNTDFSRSKEYNMVMREYTLTYSNKLKENVYLDAMVGYAKLDNVENTHGFDDDTILLGLGLHWDY